MTTPTAQIQLANEITSLLRSCDSLPSLPAVAMKVIEASKDPDIGLSDVSKIISSDPALSAKLLKIANSPVFSIRRTIHNLHEALTLLGLNTALTITLSFSLIRTLKKDASNETSNLFWKRSLISAVIARHMGYKLGLTNLEDLFLSSLLQDIGMLVLECVDAEFYLSITDSTATVHHNERILLEREKLDEDHAKIGAWLLQSWGLPEKLYQCILKSHHAGTLNPDAEAIELSQQCVNISGILADIWLHENCQPLAEEQLGHIKRIFNTELSEFDEFIDEINNQLPEFSNLFEITLTDNISREKILDQAKELLLERNLLTLKQAEQDHRLIEKMEAENRDLEDVARRDPLTNCFNRKYFRTLLDEEFENANLNRWPLSVAFIDLDNFKSINDRHGHLIGDQVLKEIASFFVEHIRQTDILARYGGDEFILMLPGSTCDVAESMLTRLQKQLREYYQSETNENKIAQTVSIGIATHIDSHDFNTVDDFLKAADEALYRTKDGGRDAVNSY